MRVETEILYKPDGKTIKVINEDYMKDLVNKSYRKYNHIDKLFIMCSLFNNTGPIINFSTSSDGTITVFYKTNCSAMYYYNFKDNTIDLRLCNISNFQYFVDNGILIYEKILISEINDRIKKFDNEILSLQLFGNVSLEDYRCIGNAFSEMVYSQIHPFDKLIEVMYDISPKCEPLRIKHDFEPFGTLYVEIGDTEIEYCSEFDTNTNILKIRLVSIDNFNDNKYPIIKELSVKIYN